MAEVIKGDTISSIKIGDKIHDIDAVTLGGKEASAFQENNIVQTIDASSDDTHYPSAACMWNEIGDIRDILSRI